MALDGNDDPAIEYLVTDPDNNDDASDTTVQFVAWDRATYLWKPTVTIAVVGIGDWNLRAGLSLAFDATTHRVGLAHMVGESDLRLALSDDGVTWRSVSVQKSDQVMAGSSLALDRGQAYLAHYERDENTGHGHARFRTGPQTDPPGEVAVFHRADPSGDVGCESPRDQRRRRWRWQAWCELLAHAGRGLQLRARVLASRRGERREDRRYRQPSDGRADAHLTLRDREAWAVFYAMRDDQFFNNVHQMWVAHSTDGGATWSAAVPVPADGGNSLGPPVNIAASAARAVVSAWVDGGNNGGTRCGVPKLIQSVDSGRAWTICSADTTAGSPTGDAVYPMSSLARNNKLYIVFKTNATEGPLRTGLVLWRER